MGVVVSSVCEEFCVRHVCRHVVDRSVKGWLKWVKKETWSYSGRCLVCKFFLEIAKENVVS